MTEQIEPCPNPECRRRPMPVASDNDPKSAARADYWRVRANKAGAEHDQYRQLIEAHNAKITAECERRRTAVWVCNVVGNCEHCPRRYLIDLPEAKL